MRFAITVVAACVLLESVLGAAPSWYSCDCGGRSNCICPSRTHPDRIPRQDVPQFVLFTHDDAILEKTAASMRAVCDSRTNPNGCPARATMFTMQYNTDCNLAYRMWKDGYEIADHTVTHPPMDSTMDKETVRYEIAGMRRWAQDACGIPANEIVGFRTPYLTTTPAVRQVLHEEGFLYDSTLMETLQYSLSNGPGQRVWPYTMDHGIAQNCGFFAPAQQCNPKNETYPGLWQVPMWPLIESGQESMMDYGPDDDHSLYDLLVANFEDALNGNRAPLPIFIHTPWFTQRRLAQLQRFADYSIGKGAYWVTIRQLINWMRNPVPASRLKLSMAMCGKAPSSPPPPPPSVPLPSFGINITLVFQGGDQSQFAPHKPMLEALVSSVLGGGPAAASVQQVRYLPYLPTSTSTGRRLLAASASPNPTAQPPAVGVYSRSGVAAVQPEGPGSHLQNGWRLLAGGTEVSFGERTGGTVANFLQYEAASATGAQHDPSMASMHGSSGMVEAANLAAGVPAGVLPQQLAAGGAAAGQQAGFETHPQAAQQGGLPAGQQLPGLQKGVGQSNPVQQPAGKHQPHAPSAAGGGAGQQPGAGAGSGAALWQAVTQLQAGAPAATAVAGQQAGVQPHAPVAPTKVATPAAKPAGAEAQPAAPSVTAVKPVIGELPAPPAPIAGAPKPAVPGGEAKQPSMPGVLQVTLVAAAADPMALYNAAVPRFRDTSFAAKLQQMGLQLAAPPDLVPFQNGWALVDKQHGSVHHRLPPPAPQSPPLEDQADEPAPNEEAQAGEPAQGAAAPDGGTAVGGSSSGSSGMAPASSSSGRMAPASSSGGSASDSSSSGSSGGIAGLPTGAFVGVVAAGTVAVAVLAVLAAVLLCRRAKAHKAAAAKHAGGSSCVQPHPAGEQQADAKSPRAQQHGIQLEVSFYRGDHPHTM